LDAGVSALWDWLASSSLYGFSGFETLFTVLIYTIVEHAYCLKFKAGSAQAGHLNLKRGILYSLRDGAVYIAPLFALDFTLTKRYTGSEPGRIAIAAQSFLQRERVLPAMAPTAAQVVLEVLVAIIIYDFGFFIIHWTLHASTTLYRVFHAKHHQSVEVPVVVLPALNRQPSPSGSGRAAAVVVGDPADVMSHPLHTNQLHIVERVVLILCANESLKVIGAHVLSRTVFIVAFIWLLVWNHTPYTHEEMRARGGGKCKGGRGQQKRHVLHHVHGDKYFQPFFTYLDDYVVPVLRGR